MTLAAVAVFLALPYELFSAQGLASRARPRS
jgi:hypothetical protein